MGAMRNQCSAITVEGAVNSEPTEASGAGHLVVNVIFTDREETARALEAAGSLAASLGASIKLLAAQAVPFRLRLDEPQVSVDFTERLLSDLAGGLDQDGVEINPRLYLCRNALETIMRVLPPNSLVVIGGRKSWWPSAASRMARVFRSEGHHVLWIDLRNGSTSELP